jgi:hypothetical protein
LRENIDKAVNFSDNSPSMKKLPLSILFLITLLVGLNIVMPAAVAVSEPDEADQVVTDDVYDDEPLAATQDENAAAAASTSATSNLGTIYAGPSASGEAVRILRTGYALQPLTNACPGCLGIIVGPADLSNSTIVNRLQAAYEAGQAVALTNATTASIQRLHDLLGHRGLAEPVPGSATVDLVAFRKAFRSDGQLQSSSHLLLPRAAATASPLNKKAKKRLNRLPKKVKRKLRNLAQRQQRQQRRLADSTDIQALSRIFSATPFVPEQPPLGSSPQQNLLQLAESYMSHAIQSDYYGNQIQLINTVWAARSFLQSADLYYVLQETDYHVVPNVTNPYNHLAYILTSWANSVNSLAFEQQGTVTVIKPSPQTTMEATVDTSSVMHTISGSAGWNETQGLNASVSGSVTISNSQTSTIPPINITNNVDLANGNTQWFYNVNELPGESETIDLFSQWIWSVPFSDYASGQTEFQYHSDAFMGGTYRFFLPFVSPFNLNVAAHLTSTVPLPFGRTFALQPPAVTSVSPISVNAGDTFTIQGTGLYPSLVQAVLIGGTALNSDNISTVSDTQIKVVAPAFFACELGCSVVVQTSQGTSNDNVTISIIP